jgi:glycosyltransferase involved in cell wall biosynthesis
LARSKILISAYTCKPNRGSEPGIGWNLAQQMAKHYEVWVITALANRQVIEAELSRSPCSHLHFVYYDFPGLTRWYGWNFLFVQIHYYLWQVKIYFLARKLHREIGFHLVHHITLGRYWTPSLLSLLPIPFLWGPVGGGESTPQHFYQGFNASGKCYESIRTLVRWLGEHDPLVLVTAQRSAVCLATTEQTASRLRALGGDPVVVLGWNGLSRDERRVLETLALPDEYPIRFISVGRLLHWKGFHLALQAFSEAKLLDSEYWIVGDGPERKRLELLARKCGVEGRVRVFGGLPRDETLLRLGECHVLVHPSMHDSSGSVCLEAMAAGRPVICLDWGGPATQVTTETGFRIAASNPAQAVQDLGRAMEKLAADKNLRRKMGEMGRERVSREFTWEHKGAVLSAYYNEILNPQGLNIP